MRVRILAADLPLRVPFSTSAWTLHARSVYLLELSDGEHTVWGEAAPLPYFGTESVDNCHSALVCAARALTTIDSADAIEAALSALPLELPHTPAARFAVECALRDMYALHAGQPLHAVLSPHAALGARIRVNAILGRGNAARIAADAEARVREGYTCLKLKVGAAALNHDLDTLRAVRARVGPAVALRADANGAWDERAALAALEAFAEFDLEYVEQPVAATAANALRRVAARSPVPVAADESLTSLAEARTLRDSGAVSVFILKPMALGELLRCVDFARESASHGAKVVFTSLIDSAVGRRAVAHAAAACAGTRDVHHGLGTGSLFEHDVADDGLANGEIVLPAAPGLGLRPDLSRFVVLLDVRHPS
ncbi:MAG: o-succinylbenzoate synthase [Ignavibacteriae bacterium]|nr:o-succinylbenzoate synthase [Ignavibacteriota bacterium]